MDGGRPFEIGWRAEGRGGLAVGNRLPVLSKATPTRTTLRRRAPRISQAGGQRIPQQNGSRSSSNSVASAVTNAVPVIVGVMRPVAWSSHR